MSTGPREAGEAILVSVPVPVLVWRSRGGAVVQPWQSSGTAATAAVAQQQQQQWRRRIWFGSSSPDSSSRQKGEM
ncbi:hypothetical protein SLEP1_g40070 [Rubroshorea leprosula]|uniref:Uncharacterized protein n=1 Tax=Rubroshorea leprosula TaxID=152421 RepID=A0AAV5L2A8_9ROSI|nr:hypothetical protein SLEP1_g40070 [Rubroshorea leprosula]